MTGPAGITVGVAQNKCKWPCSLRHSLLPKRFSSRGLVLTQAKRSAVKQANKEDAEELIPASREMLSPYEPFDDEGNEWWDPPEKDFWEGPGWEILGKSASFVLPAVLALAIAGGIYAAASYVKGPTPTAPAPQEQPAKPSQDTPMDEMLSGGGSGEGSGQGSFSDAPF